MKYKREIYLPNTKLPKEMGMGTSEEKSSEHKDCLVVIFLFDFFSFLLELSLFISRPSAPIDSFFFSNTIDKHFPQIILDCWRKSKEHITL